MAIWRRFWVQKWPKLAQNSLKWPQTTPKLVRNDVGTFFGKIDFWSFWGHFGVILGHFEPKKWPNVAYKSLTWPQTTLMARKMAQNRIFFSFCMENTHFYEFCHHGFQIRLKYSIFDEIRSILAQMKAKTMLFHVVQSASSHDFTEHTTFHQTSSKIENREIPV